MDISKLVSNFSEKNNLISGLANAEIFPHEDLLFAKHVPFTSKNPQKRINPKTSLRNAQTIIVLGMGYSSNFVKEKKDTEGNLSVLGFTSDYHNSLKYKLRGLVSELLQYDTFRYKILADTGALDERAVAVRAGLGFYGRHGMVISKKFGSRFYIGCIVTDIPWEGTKSEEPKKGCPPNCSKCLDACPSKALSLNNFRPHPNNHNVHKLGYGLFDNNLCLSHFTQKDNLSYSDMQLMGFQLYGCDICQSVCPFNSKPLEDIQTPSLPPSTSPESWLDYNEEDFSTKLGHTTMLWRGSDILRRNALVVMANLKLNQNKPKCISIAKTFLNHINPIVSKAAEYALQKLQK